MNDVKQSDIFFVEKKELVKASENIDSNKNIPLGYIPVTFASKNKLHDAVLHFRNFSMDELLEIVSSTDELQFFTLVSKALNSMVYEKFDCSMLHIEDIKQILVTIHLNFWSRTLYRRPYYIDLKGDKDDEKNIGYTDIDLKLIKTKQIDDNFTNPFTIEDNETKQKVQFILPVANHVFIADRFIKDFFAEKENSFVEIKSNIALVDAFITAGKQDEAKSVKLTIDQKKEYNNFLAEKDSMYIKALQCQLLYSIDGKVLNTIEEKLDAYKHSVSASIWSIYKNVVKDNAAFGIDDSYTFVGPDGKKITRRFSFRLMEFLPSMEQESNSRYSVHFTS